MIYQLLRTNIEKLDTAKWYAASSSYRIAGDDIVLLDDMSEYSDELLFLTTSLLTTEARVLATIWDRL
jgi:hypothetical protein